MSGGTVFKNKFLGVGVVLMLAGAFPLGQAVYHLAFGVPAVAEVTGIEMVCRVKTCAKCSGFELACPDADARRREFHRVERVPYAELWFQDRAGQAVTTRAAFTMVGLSSRTARGDRVKIRYMSHNPRWVARRGVPAHAFSGLWMIILGGVIAWFAGGRALLGSWLEPWLERAGSPPAPMPAPVPMPGRAPEPAYADAPGEPSRWRSRPNWSVSGKSSRSNNSRPDYVRPSDRSSRPKPIAPRRTSVAQRNRSWFG